MSDDKQKNRMNDPILNEASNCHRTGKPKPDGADDNSDQDSSTSKYVVKDDKRERRDGPGGN